MAEEDGDGSKKTEGSSGIRQKNGGKKIGPESWESETNSNWGRKGNEENGGGRGKRLNAEG
jgi:hypothetical protein